jgi:hypothetical protein
MRPTPGSPAIPEYFQRRWTDFKVCRYAQEARQFECLTGMGVDKTRPPFICAGNLEDRETPRILSFGLAPHAGSEYIPVSLDDYYRWRVGYFDTDRIPHTLHSRFGGVCCGMLGVAPPQPSEQSRWLHHNGYVTFDLAPYYIRRWKNPNWRRHGGQCFRAIRDHFRECVALLGESEVRLAIFSGKAWEELLIANAPSQRLAPFEALGSFPLLAVTWKAFHKRRVHLGYVDLGEGRRAPAIVIAHLLQSIHGLERDHPVRIGRYARYVWRKGRAGV